MEDEEETRGWGYRVIWKVVIYEEAVVFVHMRGRVRHRHDSRGSNAVFWKKAQVLW
jgi:hypothetical protein